MLLQKIKEKNKMKQDQKYTKLLYSLSSSFFTSNQSSTSADSPFMSFFCTFVFSFIFLLSFAYFKSKLHFNRTDAIIMCVVNSASPGLVSLSFSKNFHDSYFLCQCFSVSVILNPRDSFGISWARTVFSP